MAPTEEEILSNFLLLPAGLAAIVSLDQFRALFPRPVQDSPRLQSLFRDLQAQRAQRTDQVAANIGDETRGRAAALRREVLRLRREAERDEADGEIELDRALFGDASAARKAKHSLHSILPELQGAVGALEAEIRQLEEEEAELTAELGNTIGSLSDLRYGKLANSQLREEVVDGLGSLQDACRSRKD